MDGKEGGGVMADTNERCEIRIDQCLPPPTIRFESVRDWKTGLSRLVQVKEVAQPAAQEVDSNHG